MAALITVRVVRPVFHAGQHVAVGALLKVPPLIAGELLAVGRTVLAHADDRKLVLEAVAEDVRRALKRAGTPRAAPPLPSPWRPL